MNKNLRTRIMATMRWFPKSFEGSLLTFLPQARVAVQGPCQRYPFVRWFAIGYHHDDNRCDWLWPLHVLERVRARLLAKNNLHTFITGEARAFQQAFRAFDRYDARSWSVSLASLSSNELLRMSRMMTRLAYPIGSIGYLAECFHYEGSRSWVTMMLEDRVKGLDRTRAEECTHILVEPLVPTLSQQEHDHIESIAGLVKRSGYSLRAPKHILRALAQHRALRRMTNEHILRFSSVHSNYFFFHRITREDIAAAIVAVARDGRKSHRRSPAQLRREKQAVIRSLGNPLWLRDLVFTIEQFSWMQDLRKSIAMRLAGWYLRLAEEVARRNNENMDDYRWIFPGEIEDILHGTKMLQSFPVIQRRKATCIVYEPRSMSIEYGDAVDQTLIGYCYGAPAATDTLEGLVASKGTATGVVRIVRDYKSIHAFAQSEVLVANNTTPDYMPAIQKAAAIVAEQGGITIHAAVISREMNIPCVIGVKHATKILKDGDRVEVDAIRGLIKKL